MSGACRRPSGLGHGLDRRSGRGAAPGGPRVRTYPRLAAPDQAAARQASAADPGQPALDAPVRAVCARLGRAGLGRGGSDAAADPRRAPAVRLHVRRRGAGRGAGRRRPLAAATLAGGTLDGARRRLGDGLRGSVREPLRSRGHHSRALDASAARSLDLARRSAGLCRRLVESRASPLGFERTLARRAAALADAGSGLSCSLPGVDRDGAAPRPRLGGDARSRVVPDRCLRGPPCPARRACRHRPPLGVGRPNPGQYTLVRACRRLCVGAFGTLGRRGHHG